ncbi:MAG: UDP-N-acetylmuramate--L-alanine ligase [Flavobacteriales bacterium]|nr:UDP-N-acetylmuramate--L-alanine ligase [Flavobacteriales bacterium]
MNAQLEKSHVYLIGVGGIGMSALARFFNKLGKQVGGYDRATTKLTKQLQTEGIKLTDIQDADAIPQPFRDKENTLVIFTPAIPKSHPIRAYFEEEGFRLYKRAEVLGLLSKDLKTIAVSGTHGKTTTSAMISYLLKSIGIKLNAFLGGISADFSSNLILEEGAELMVTEADEFDRSFLQLEPDIAIVTSLDIDHLDIYEDRDDMLDTYRQFTRQLRKDGSLLCKSTIESDLQLGADIESYSYGLNDIESDYAAENIGVVNGNYQFDLRIKDRRVKGLTCGLPGIHNVENAVAALAVCDVLGLNVEDLREALSSFRGVMRRFDVHIKRDDFVYIDDYAHHPKEIAVLLQSVKELYPGKKITTIFQPHLYSRTKDLGNEFAEALSESDDLILLELYPAREEPIEGIDSRWLSRKVKLNNVPVCKKEQLMNLLKEREIEVLLTVGAGDIDTLIPQINEYYL